MLESVMNKFYAQLFFGGVVEQRAAQLTRLKLPLPHGCQTCNRQNIPGALAAGFTQRQVDALICANGAPFTHAERAVIAYAAELALTNLDGRLTPQLLADLRRRFCEAQILELGTMMASMAKQSFPLDVVEPEDYCPFANEAARTVM